METTVVRIDKRLIKQAKEAEKKTKRRPTKQIEHWAEIGKLIEEKLNGSEIEAVLEGRARVELNPEPSALSMKNVMQALAEDRRSGKLADQVKVGKEWFETSRDLPGHLVRITADGTREIGSFVDGKFVAKAKSK